MTNSIQNIINFSGKEIKNVIWDSTKEYKGLVTSPVIVLLMLNFKFECTYNLSTSLFLYIKDYHINF